MQFGVSLFQLSSQILQFDYQNIKLSSMRAKAAEDLADEGDAAGAAIVQARNKFLTQVNCLVLSERNGKGMELEWREGERKEGRKIAIIIMTVTTFTLIPRNALEF